MTTLNDAAVVREMRALRETGELPGGVLIAGRVYRNFTVGMLDGNITQQVQKEMADDEGVTAGMVEAALLARRLKFEGMPDDMLTYQAIMELPTPDMDAIYEAINRLTKKYKTFRSRKAETATEDGGAARPESGSQSGGGSKSTT